MADHPETNALPPPDRDSFRWQALFHHAREAIFLLNQHRRVLIINRACEEIMHLRAIEVRGMVCGRRVPAEPSPRDALARALCPPPEVFEGRTARVRRQVQGTNWPRRWWNIDFFPLEDGKGRLRILGKIHEAEVNVETDTLTLPDKLQTLREKLDGNYDFDRFESVVPSMKRLSDQVLLASQNRASVLILGEPGTDRTAIARVIHHQGCRREKNFAALDCARLSASALGAALFDQGGLTRLPQTGTICLKEVERLPRDAQTRLCDWLALAGPTSARLIAITSVNLDEEVRANRVLEKLYFALSTLVIAAPPLRERRDDLPRIVDRYWKRTAAEQERKVASLTPAAWEIIRRHDWPGNLPELVAALECARKQAKGDQGDRGDLPSYLRMSASLDDAALTRPPRILALDPLLEQVERRLIAYALRQAKGNKSRAAELLSIWRPRLLRRLETLGIGAP